MRKIAIITLVGNFNYGNRLQNCAVHRIAEKLGFCGETIIIKRDVLRRFKSFLFKTLKKKDKIERLKEKNFENFNKKHIIIKKIPKRKTKGALDSEYTYAFLGGDQIWGEYKQEYGIYGFAFGSIFAPEKRVTISPSFGSSNIKKENEDYYKRYLSELKHISVREQSGADIIRRLIGRDATVVIDPVMVLTADEWKNVFDLNKYSDDEYLLSCFIGGTNAELDKKIEEISNGIEIKKMYDKSDTVYSEGPDGFLSLIYNAKIICTDSFHCAAFAVLFKKTLVVFDRLNIEKTQNTRLLNLLEKFELENRYIENLDVENCFACNYSHIDEILEKERKKFFEFLNLCMGEKNE